MYESEVNDRWENADAIPEAVRKKWAEMGKNISARSLIPWGEHCTECAIPHCFTTCDLYKQRKGDLSCSRFTEGMVCVSGVEGIMPWLLKIHFKQWAKLWGDATTGMVSLDRANRLERLNSRLGAIVQAIPLPKRIKKSITWRYRNLRNRLSLRQTSAEVPDYFLIEIFNPATAAVAMTFYLRERHHEAERPFTARFMAHPGLNRMCFPLGTINAYVDLKKPFHVELSPSESVARPTLYFGCMEFVRDTSFVPAGKPGSCKCVVWDLDNTVWDGVLVEDGPNNLVLKPGILETFAELDRRGILQSVASKNNPDDVMPVLTRFGMAEYILKPEISWEPKGQAVRRIAHSLNIGIDSLIYVDDSPFERAEVSGVCPEALVIDAADVPWLPWREECQVASTEESMRRRLLYRDQENREEARAQSAGDYEAFLRDCKIEIRILPLDEKLLPRVHELAQRTNQMNFSGMRYTREQLETVRLDDNLDAMAVEVEDRFGNYGIVGFGIVDRKENVLTDLAFSCRIQSKRIEHALLAYFLAKYPKRPFRARWRKTERNAPTGKVFADLGFREAGEVAGVTELDFDSAEIPRFDFITLKTGAPA